ARRRWARPRHRAADGEGTRRRRASRVTVRGSDRGDPSRRRSFLPHGRPDRSGGAAGRAVNLAMRSLAGPAAAACYLDWNATTPPHPDVLEAMRAAAEEAWANPASVHAPGRRAREAIEAAREAVAALVGLEARDVVLTSGGTEANNLALRSAAIAD